MSNLRLTRRTALQAMLLASTAPCLMKGRAFASSCGNNIVNLAGIVSPDTLNPFASWANFWPLVFTYDWLVAVDAQRHPDRKGFASEWSVADDNVTWTLTIWPGMKWSDGQPATAKDAAFTYNYLLGSVGTPDELNVGWNNTSGLELVDSIKAVDDETLQIKTKVPTRWPIDNLTMIVPEHIWSHISYADARGTFQNNAPLVGTGPMIVTEFHQGQFARFAPNSFFRTGKPAVAGAIFRFFSTSDPIAQGIKSGEFDFGMSLTVAQWEDLSKDPNIQVGQSRTEQRNYLAFNTKSGEGAGSTQALQDRAFREAIGYAIDQKAIVDRAFRGHADVGVGLIPSATTELHPDLSDIKRNFDLSEAARRLDAAGYRDANGDGIREDKEGNDLQLELLTGNFSGNIEIPVAAVQLVAGWLTDIGVPVSVTQLDSGALRARTAPPAKGGGGWDLLIANSWPGSAPGQLLGIGSSKLIDAGNPSYWTNEKFDKLLSEIDTAVDLEAIRDLVDQAERLIYNEAPYISLGYPFVLSAYRKDCITGWGPDDDMLSMGNYYPLDRLRPL